MEKLATKTNGFKQRKYYWKKKGMSDEKAAELAAGRRGLEKSKVVQLHLANSIAPMAVPKKIPDTKKINPIKNNKNIKSILSQVGIGALICVLSFILIQATASVFGNNLLGYLKATCLEIGILLLAMMAVKSKTERFFKNSILLAAILLSFFVLHAGATIGAATSNKQIEQESLEIQTLTETRSRLLANHDSLPIDYTTKRNAIITEIKELDSKISVALLQSKSSPSMTALTAATNTEIWSRAVFLLMNLFFGHLLAQRLRWGRESLT